MPEDPHTLPSVLFERILHVLGSVGDFQIGMVLSFDGNVDPELMERAVELSIDAGPHMKCRFKPQYFGAQWEKISSLEPSDYFQAKIKGAANDVIAFLSDPIDHCTGPQVNVLLLRGDQDTLCLKIAHHAADAGGVKEFTYCLAEIYRRLQGGIEFRPKDYVFGQRDLSQVIAPFPIFKRWRILRSTIRDLFSHPPYPLPLSIPGKEADINSKTYHVHHIGKELFRPLAKWSSAHGYTINDAFMAATLRVLHRMDAGGKGKAYRLVVTADLRRYLPTDALPVIANLSGWVLATLGNKLGTTFQDTCSLVHECMKVRKADCLGLGMIPLLALMDLILPLSWLEKGFVAAASMASRNGHIAPSFTNMGIIDAKRLDFGTIDVVDAYLVPPIVYPPVFGFGVSGFSDSLTFSCGYCSPGFITETIEAFFENLESELPIA